MRSNWASLATLLFLGLALPAAFLAQDPAVQQAAEEAPKYRPLEGSVIINLPSVEAPKRGTLTLLFTHRFVIPVQESSLHDLYSIGDHAEVGIGLSYAPLKSLDVSFYRSTELEVYELAAKYRLLSHGAFEASIRSGADWRTAQGVDHRFSFFAQGILAISAGPRVRVTVVPTYLSQTSDFVSDFVTPPAHDHTCRAPIPPVTLYLCSGFYRDIFNVPVAVSLAVTRSISVHGEITPRYGRADSQGVGWIVAVEKTVRGHRFSVTAGSQRATTVDRYTAAVPPSAPFPARDVYLGFNLTRDWNLK